ncbi:TetR/AcrR family transcriptional regulator [Spongiactinospora sp. TRM90649]|uniref:TetR/AcrR family transcriptional regulator n=1 Tax=Spongiactinospora sp. TRM90649 TaxID=3031114 RepID=UPI0023F9DA32|nr:TetR/AcrR family transcriptional regulator [Spongiactinospora sp. TRM90649]MDF5753935.1 TetR/AcrR family transcriptional regulator [Spongiactinospora sp. TRM90649]
MPAKPQYTSIWAREAAEKSQQSRSPGKDQPSRRQIVRATIELLDAEGGEALSMRRLGAKLGMGATSIYWYVANKTELLDLALDEVFGEIAVPESASLDWREATSVFAHSLRRALMRHAWATQLLGGRPNLGPNALRVAERMSVIFHDAGFRRLDVDFGVTTVIAYVMGLTSADSAWRDGVAGSGMTQEEWTAEHEPAIALGLADHPRLRELWEERELCADSATVLESRFDYGLACVLDGLETRRSRPNTARTL